MTRWQQLRAHLTGAQLREIARFLVVGGFCFLIDYGLLYVFTEYGGIPYLWSSALSFSVSVVVNYFLCVHFVFAGAKQQSAAKAALFFLTGVMGLGINQIVMWALVDGAGIYYMLAKLVSTAVVTIWNFITKKLVVTH